MPTLKNSCAAATSAGRTATTMIKTSSKSCNHMPRKRRRYLSELQLMLMTFVVSFSCLLIMGPLEAAAAVASASTMQDYGSVTAEGENMFMVATNLNGNNDDDLGNALPYVEAGTDDDAEGEGTGDATNDAGGGKMALMPNAKNEHVATEDIEMMQPPHNMRHHEEHYKSRLLQQHQLLGLSDFKPPQPENDVSLHNRHLRYQQIQQALREPVTLVPPVQQKPQQHHHQHRHHHDHHSHQRHHHLARQEEFKWPSLQRSRHHHDHDHLRHHRRHNFTSNPTSTTSTTTTTTTTMRPRYFDRDGLYTNPLAWLPTTQGPLHVEQHSRFSSKHHYNPHNRLFNDEDMDAENRMANEEDNEEEFKRISLSLDANKETAGNEKLFDTSTFDSDDDADEDDDYSYEDDDDTIGNKNNEQKIAASPSLAGATKTNVKRYTNPSRSSYRPALTLSANKRQHSAKFADDDNNDDYDNNNDDVATHSSEESNSKNNNNNDDDNDNFSDEKWNKIEHEHYRKQMQHQRAMQALRSRRPSASSSSSSSASSPMDNTPNSIMKSNKFVVAAASKSATAAKRQILNDDDSDNIYSRYYVPGSVTRKKEEELGSPTAMLESRRQYALQQRQNKALASAHHRRIVKEGSCRLPQPRVERIRRDSWKIYTPHCTILHRCADDTGCCPTERQTCAPKRTKNVDLYFFVISLNETQGSIERLTFVNHTECHCVDKSKQRPPEYVTDDFGSRATDLSSNHIPFLRRATILNCNCPNLYEKILQEDGFCRCDCSSGNLGCDWLKRGMEHFSMNDRKCISEGRCKLPTCEYGAYMKKLGRCPRREERQLSIDTVDW